MTPRNGQQPAQDSRIGLSGSLDPKKKKKKEEPVGAESLFTSNTAPAIRLLFPPNSTDSAVETERDVHCMNMKSKEHGHICRGQVASESRNLTEAMALRLVCASTVSSTTVNNRDKERSESKAIGSLRPPNHQQGDHCSFEN